MCVGTNDSLINVTGSGTWGSSNTTVASIQPNGVVTGQASGTSTITYTLSGGCFSTSQVTVNALPSPIPGTTTLCQGNTTSLTEAGGGTWISANTAVASVDPASGTVTAIGAGSTNITYTLPTGCATGALVSVNASPAPISGPINACVGSSATLTDVAGGGTWQSANTAVASIGPASGVINPISAGTSTITYTLPTGCSVTSTFGVTSFPVIYTVIGGGSYCAGGTGVHVRINGSDIGASYQLYNTGLSSGSPVIGTGAVLDFGAKTAAGSYEVIANPGTSCAATMLGSVNVVVNPVPTAYSVAGGGDYCSGGTGVHIFLSNSASGVNYQLMVGGVPSAGGAFPGASAPIDFGAKTTSGSYTVVGTNSSTGCTATMSGAASIIIDALPSVFSVTGGGAYCAGATGEHVGLSNSASGINYQLLVGGVPSSSPVSGTGSPIDFGVFTTNGVYAVTAINPTTACSSNMSGSVLVTVNPWPTAYLVTGGGNYCAGGTGVHVGLNASTPGVNYQLFNSGIASGSPISGSGVTIDFGLKTAAGTYTVVGTGAGSGCNQNMSGAANIGINPLPLIHTPVTGGGGYCVGTGGVHIGLNNSATGINYQLFNGGVLAGAASGSGIALDFGLKTSAGSYTVVGTNPTTGCVANMLGSASVSINPLPTVFAVTGGGNYCIGGTGVHVGLANSTSGIQYQLYNISSAVGTFVTGAGLALDFGLQTATGNYTIFATNASTGCISNMTGSASIATNPLPTTYLVTGGGAYCSGSGGADVGLSFSDIGTNYQLINGTAAVATALPGTNSMVMNFGTQTAAGTYTVLATKASTACSVNMSGNATVSVNLLPTAFNVTGGGNYCAGGTGVHIGLANSQVGMIYQLYAGSTAVGSAPMAGITAGVLDFGPQSATGIYHVIAIQTLQRVVQII